MSTITETLRLPRLEPISLSENGSHPLADCCGPRVDGFVRQTFVQLFAGQVQRGPQRPAVVSGDERLTFQELDRRANRLAHYLRALGVGRETLVGICIDRSLEMAVGILGILKAGAAYLPLDPEYPAERLTWILRDSGVRFVVSKAGLTSQLTSTTSDDQPAARFVLLDADAPDARAIARQSDLAPAPGPNPADLAYVIYTSGSTGAPKGVMITHASLGNYVLALQHELGIDKDDRYLHTASIAFSSSRRQLLLPLSQGAQVVIASSDQRKDPTALFEMIKDEGVTVMDAVPSFWRNCTEVLAALAPGLRRQLLDNKLRLMLSASEPLLSDIPGTWMNEFGHRARHVHMFGQTETAGIVCVNKIPAYEDSSASVVPVGRPIANSEIYIFDEEGNPAPVGVAGEMLIGGAGVGRGYLNRPELTAEKFIPSPFDPAARLYRTGDWARYRADGQIEFVGRRDSQVKLRGFRVELGEIEAVLSRHQAVKECAVVARDDRGNGKRLIAYFVSRDNETRASELRTFLSSQLPDYMVPATFVQLTALPLSANGKVDKRALPEPDVARPELAAVYQAPQTPTEEILANIWSEVLQIEKVGIDDDFFELGGHSLIAIQAIARVNAALKITVPLRLLFDGPTVNKLAARIDSVVAGAVNTPSALERVNRDGDIPLSFAQQRFWFLDQLEPANPLYNINRAMRLRGPLDTARLERAINSIVARHEALRTTFVAPGGEPFQKITDSLVVPLPVFDLRSVPAPQREEETQRLLESEVEKPFDLSHGPLLRVTLFRVGDEEHLLLFSIHHIISDTWAIGIFFQELAAFYENQSAPQLSELRVQYADFAQWQRTALTGEFLQPELSYWKTQLAGAPAALELPTDYPRPATASYRGARQSISLPYALGQSLRELSRREGTTLFMTLAAAFQALLGLYSGQDDVIVGTPVAGRGRLETEALIGCFVNTLVLRGDLSGDPSFRELLQRTREAGLGAYTHQEIPFEKLVEALQPARSLTRSPIFQVMFVLQDETKPELLLPGIDVSPVPIATTTTKFELALGVVEKPEGLDVWLSYSIELFKPESMASLLADFRQLLESSIRNPEERISKLATRSWQPAVPAQKQLAARAPGTLEHRHVYRAPGTPIEERLAGIWSEVLRVDQVSIDDNFFQLGGHSLLAAQVISRARNIFSVEVPLRRLFETPTVAGLAEAIYDIQTSQVEDEELAAILAELSQLSEEDAQLQSAERV